MREIQDIQTTMPTTQEEKFVNGEITFDDGNHVVFQMPAVFNEDGTLNEAETNTKLQTAIELMKNATGSSGVNSNPATGL